LLGVCLFAARVLPQPAAPAAGTSAGGGALSAPALIGLAGVFCLYVGLGGLWTYVERIGITAGLAPALIGDDLTIASLCGVAGCGTAILIGGRFGRIAPLLLGFGLIVCGVLGLLGMPSALRYLLAAGCFKYAWTFALPYVLAGMSSHDRSGRLMALSNFMIGGGLAVGPAVIAAALSSPPNYAIAPLLALAFSIASLGLLLWSNRKAPVA
jgi:hypothetical protein